jgi:hypothetical protein
VHFEAQTLLPAASGANCENVTLQPVKILKKRCEHWSK